MLYELISPQLQEYLERLGVSLRRSGKKFVGTCPVHNGDNNTAFIIYPDGHTMKCKWMCLTHRCEKHHGGNIIGLTKGIIGCSNDNAIKYILDYLEITPDDLNTDEALERRCQFIQESRQLNQNAMKDTGWPRNEVRKHLQFPADYFVKRGYSPELLELYDIGTCKSGKYPNRVIVPMYNENWDIMVGFHTRTTRPQCPSCNKHHFLTEECPQSNKFAHSKWKCQEGFELHKYLYNYWKAKQYILADRYVILVEGPADVWTLEANGEHHALAINGTELSDEQMITLEKSGALNLFLAFDNDKAGEKVTKGIQELCGRIFNVQKLEYGASDVGNASSEEIKKMLSGVIV